ncbi:hypothetical protein SAMN04488102_10523 [Alkalibacterium subtropicum]|uniref:Uncharacterized protein n=1 Tax=Alkalibacterium subtropicum TaxID=753702 RepID=A0A1I1IA97_9LACT|nr:hypothetical protein [Alkalibacterium subtropicum]SFC33084.1 hypothetical protein SAMN04488102_10523 [Alkalibacterium subtropicum]
MKKKLTYIGIAFGLLLLFLPYIAWQLDSGRALDVLIMDKTVPDQTYREHKGITWALNHYKYIKSDQTAYDLTHDYTGFHPLEENQYDVSSLPVEEKDLIYMADTYGVYENEFYDLTEGETRSGLIYGGLTAEELAYVEEEMYASQTPLIAEFNSFASPTTSEVQDRFTSILGINWNGWTARYFNELDPELNSEIPLWILENYEQQTQETWGSSGPGLVFVKNDEHILVLEEGQDFEGEGVRFDFTSQGQAFFGMSLSSQYGYWFDIVEAEAADVLATYSLGLTEKGSKRLSEYDIENMIPAVTRNTVSGTPAYYFAGDFADMAATPSFYKYKGMDWLYRMMSWAQLKGTNAFYYRAYLPMMHTILQETHEGKSLKNKEDQASLMYEEEELAYPTRVNDTAFEVYSSGKWEEVEIQGVNMGIAKPGSWPGETAITYEEYARWLTQISDMGANVIRVYTIHPPEFYKALWMHNQQTDSPLYLVHGVWINEENLVSTLDAYSSSNIDPFENEIRDAVDVVHGNINLNPESGHASGEYAYDISPYIMGYILGIEWYPRMVEETNTLHESQEEFTGEYFTTKEANAFEKWLAQRMEYLTDYEASMYGTMHPISFTNWPTTDLLDHPAEPLAEEDRVSVDPNTIHATDRLKTGYFASYHVYPYYPDFLNYEQAYLDFIDHRGEKNSYAGYLNDLIQAHRMPVVIAEFGVPSSRGMTHENPYGWNQGFHSEKEQGAIDVRLFEDIRHQGAAGGILFTWQDEWFKRTWNTMKLDDPDRRPYWSNMQTNEQHFGLLSFETHKKPLDGSRDKWQAEEISAEKEDGLLHSISASHDEAYLYFMIDYDPQKWTSETDVTILLDTIDQQGNIDVPFIADQTFSEGIDFVIELSASNESRVWIDKYYDPFHFQFSYALEDTAGSQKVEKNSGQFHTIKLPLSMPMDIPSTGEHVPFQYYETGVLKEGIGSPESEEYDSLADYIFNRDSGILEVRIPWLMLNVKNPSQKEIMGDIQSEGLSASDYIEAVEYSVVTTENSRTTDQLPEKNAKDAEMVAYTWENWDQPVYEERLKESYKIIKEYLNE